MIMLNTFSLYRFKMVLVSFTVLDHHKKSIIVDVGSLSKETIESYVKLHKAFLRSPEQKAPKETSMFDSSILQLHHSS